MRVLDLRGQRPSEARLRSIVPRQTSEFVSSAEESVASILADVKSRGTAALRELAARFDGVEQAELRVPQDAIDRAVEELDPAVRDGLETAIERTRARGFSPSSRARLSLISSIAAAPSERAEEVPAVTVPVTGSNAGLSAASASTVVSGRITSS